MADVNENFAIKPAKEDFSGVTFSDVMRSHGDDKMLKALKETAEAITAMEGRIAKIAKLGMALDPKFLDNTKGMAGPAYDNLR